MVIAFVEGRSGDALPVYLTRFFGREPELQLLADLLADPSERVVTLVGPGGVGKTRLLVEAIGGLGRSDTSGIVFIDGTALDRPALLLPEIVERLGLDHVNDWASGELLSEWLAGKNLLLLLDNMEHLLPAAVDIAGLVRALPGLRVVATSRSPLHISGERVFDVEPLRTEAERDTDIPVSIAAQLFVDRAVKTGNGCTSTGRDLEIIETICAQLDGLPLAIELAAARLRVLSLPALHAVLSNQLAVLTGGPVDIAERHRALRAAIAWSYDLLGPDEQRLLRELGVFADSFALEGIGAVSSLPQERLIDVLESLVDQALLMRVQDELGDQTRFRMLVSIRDFAIEKLREAGDEERIRDRHATWFLNVAEQLDPALRGPGQEQVVARLTRIAPNLRQALDFLVSRGDQERALRFVAALARYWLMRVQLDEARAAFAEVFALAAPIPTHAWGAALRGAAIIAETQYDCETALRWNRQAIAIWEERGDHDGIARSRIDLGNVYNNMGRFDEARAEFARAAEIADQTTDPRNHLIALGSMASAMLRQGALREAAPVFAAVIPGLRGLDDRWVLATCLSNFGIVRQRLGDRAEARVLFEESLSLRESLGDEYGVGASLANLGSVQDDPAIGAEISQRALEIGIRLGAADIHAAAQSDLGIYALDRNDRSTAARLYIDALNGYASINEEISLADTIGLIAELTETSDPTTAARLLGWVRGTQQAHRLEPFGPIADRIATIEQRTRERLGAVDFETEMAHGRQFTLAEVQVEALQAARAGGSQWLEPLPADKRPGRTADLLTARELDVLRLIAAGNTDRQIAEELFISPKTANHHVTRILAKLECRNRAAATAFAFQQGLVSS